MTQSQALDGAKWFIVDHFERLLVFVLVASLLLIHVFVDEKIAFLSFYYLPVIVAGFHLGKRVGTFSALLIVVLVAFVQAVVGLNPVYGPGLVSPAALTLLPWAGFLVLTGYVVGMLGEQRAARLDELKDAYITMLEILTFHLETNERRVRGHSYRVAARAVGIARALGLRPDEVEHLRVAALLHELSPADPRLMRLFEHFPGSAKELPVAESMRAALDIVREYAGYYEHVGGDWPIDHLRMSLGTKILALADAFETLQVSSGNRPSMTQWAAIDEIERGRGVTFSTDVVRALRSAIAPDKLIEVPILASA
jgi:hypothetical protein